METANNARAICPEQNKLPMEFQFAIHSLETAVVNQMLSVAIVMNAKMDTITSYRATVVRAVTAIQSEVSIVHAKDPLANVIVNQELLGK